MNSNKPIYDIDFSLINELKVKINEAESRVNHIKEFSGLDIPAINELRYALNHLVRYLTGDQDSINGAIKHTKRAIYDCYETEAMYSFKTFMDFETENDDISLIDIFPAYYPWAKKFEELQDFIKQTEKNDRQCYYEKLGIILDNIREFHLEVRSVKNEILKLRGKKEEEKKLIKKAEERAEIAEKRAEIAEKRTKIQSYITIIALIITILTFIFGNNIKQNIFDNNIKQTKTTNIQSK